MTTSPWPLVRAGRHVHVRRSALGEGSACHGFRWDKNIDRFMQTHRMEADNCHVRIRPDPIPGYPNGVPRADARRVRARSCRGAHPACSSADPPGLLLHADIRAMREQLRCVRLALPLTTTIYSVAEGQ